MKCLIYQLFRSFNGFVHVHVHVCVYTEAVIMLLMKMTVYSHYIVPAIDVF